MRDYSYAVTDGRHVFEWVAELQLLPGIITFCLGPLMVGESRV